MALRAGLPLMDGAMSSAVAVATHPTPMEKSLCRRGFQQRRGFDGRGGTHGGCKTIDGAPPCTVGGRVEGCHGVGCSGSADSRRYGIAGSPRNAPNPDGAPPREPADAASKRFDGRGGTH
eukprot:1191433-Prymnesium_polylepis.1